MKRSCYIFLALLFLGAGSAGATTHIIKFGGNLGLKFSPGGFGTAPLEVNVGDTLMWQGDFSLHTLQSDQIPASAATFSKKDFQGNSFTYVVTVAGTYKYECTVHGPQFNMTGVFHAAAAGVEPPKETKIMMDPIYPNPAMEEAMVHFTLEKPGHVTLKVFDATGKLALTGADENMESGFHMLMIDTKQLPSGSYQYVLQSGEAVLRRAMIVVK